MAGQQTKENKVRRLYIFKGCQSRDGWRNKSGRSNAQMRGAGWIHEEFQWGTKSKLLQIPSRSPAGRLGFLLLSLTSFVEIILIMGRFRLARILKYRPPSRRLRQMWTNRSWVSSRQSRRQRGEHAGKCCRPASPLYIDARPSEAEQMLQNSKGGTKQTSSSNFNCVKSCGWVQKPGYGKDAAALKISNSRVEFCYRKARGKFGTGRETRHGIATTLAQLWGIFFERKYEGKEKKSCIYLVILRFPADLYINKTGFSHPVVKAAVYIRNTLQTQIE